MSIKSLSYSFVVGLGIFLCGCKGPTGPAGPSLTGSLTGFVSLVQSDGSRPADLSGVTVSIDGTSLGTQTDSTGKWTIGGISTGIYSLTYSKPGYGAYRIENQQFVGGGTLYEAKPTLAQPPNFTVGLDMVKTITDSNSVYVNATISNFDRTYAENGYVLIALGTTPNVSVLNANNYLFASLYYIGGGQTTIASHIYKGYLEGAGFTSGTTAYLVVYPLSYVGNTSGYTSYTDQATGRTIYSSVGTPSAQMQVTIP